MTGSSLFQAAVKTRRAIVVRDLVILLLTACLAVSLLCAPAAPSSEVDRAAAARPVVSDRVLVRVFVPLA